MKGLNNFRIITLLFVASTLLLLSATVLANENAIALGYTASPVDSEISITVTNNSTAIIDAVELTLEAGLMLATDSNSISVGSLGANETKVFIMTTPQVATPDMPASVISWQVSYTSNGLQYTQIINSTAAEI